MAHSSQRGGGGALHRARGGGPTTATLVAGSALGAVEGLPAGHLIVWGSWGGENRKISNV